MKRGERGVWRELAEQAQKVAESKNYAEEYIAKIEFRGIYAQMCGGISFPNNSFQLNPELMKMFRKVRRAGTR